MAFYFFIFFAALLLGAATGFFAAFFFRLPYKGLKKVPFELHELFTECHAIIAPKAAEKGIMLHFYAEPAISKIPLGDPDRLREVLTLLLSNAVRFTNTGMVKLHSAINETHPNRRKKTIAITFEVKDSGVGISGKRKYRAKDLVEMLGGKLKVESTPGIGSKFSFDLVFKTIDASVDHSSGHDAAKENAPDDFEKPLFEGEVLLCEDSAMNQQIICEHLTLVGVKTVVAKNGKIGVETVESRMKSGEKLFDLILMDIHMPVMDGLEAASKILALNTGIPVVAITANIMPTDLEIYRMSGMYDSIGKPFTTRQIWHCLGKYLKPVSHQATGHMTAESHSIEIQNRMRQKMIVHFVEDSRNKIVEITDALSAGDVKLANRMAHNLKSNAGHVGKILLQQAAEEVERHLEDEKNHVTPRQMADLETELNAALAELIPLAELVPEERI
jgi:CheY-like chemotaxis protein